MKKISTKLWVLMLSLILITLALLWFFQINFLENFYTKSEIHSILNEGNSLSKLISEKASSEKIKEKIDEMDFKFNAGIDIISANGQVVYTNSVVRIIGMNIDRQLIFKETMEGKPVILQAENSNLKIKMLIAGIPIIDKNKVIAAAIISAPLAPVKETSNILKEQLIIITAILVIISLVLSYLFSKAFTKPILEINEAVGQMAAGNLLVKIDVKSKDELGVLAEKINYLSLELQKIEQLRRELVANVSHEFRTPLSLIRGYAETIKDITGNNHEKRNKQLDIILEESDRLRKMIDDLLYLSQMQAHYFQLEKKTLSINQIINSVYEKFDYMQQTSNIKLVKNLSEEDVLSDFDGMKIEQVLYNLIYNAFCHTESDSEIYINTTNEQENILVEVADKGHGIPEDELPYIWDRFYKANNAENVKSSQGTGLGLAIVKSILEAHGASFGVDSKLGAGARFWFRLTKSK